MLSLITLYHKRVRNVTEDVPLRLCVSFLQVSESRVFVL
jgi:hypothetical protein